MTYGEWGPTPWWLRLLGYPAQRRPVFEYAQLGGGVYEWEYSHGVE